MPNYTGLAATASRLISEFGRNMTLRTEVATGDAWNPTLTPSDVTVKGVVYPISKYEQANSLVESGDMRVYLAADAAITNAKFIVDDGIEWSVVSLEQIKPGDTLLLYDALVRK